MHSDWSACATYDASRSASEWTITVRRPRPRQARRMRRAISPRLAMRTVSNTITSREAKQGLPGFDFLSRRHQYLGDGRVVLGEHFVEHLHRFDDAHRLACLDGLADGDERWVARGLLEVDDAENGRRQFSRRTAQC